VSSEFGDGGFARLRDSAVEGVGGKALWAIVKALRKTEGEAPLQAILAFGAVSCMPYVPVLRDRFGSGLRSLWYR
jgi:hypothetical protein